MNYRTLIVAVALIAVRSVVPFASAEPKAYDTVFYKGRAAGLKIVFEFAQSHVEASNVKITKSASGKTTKFYLSGRDGEILSRAVIPPPVKLFRSPLQKGRSTERLNCGSSSRNAVNLSSARATKRFPSSRCASNPDRAPFGINQLRPIPNSNRLS
jgi:hypothetical protein